MRIGFLISSARVVRPTWTTAHLAHAALVDQHQVRIMEANDIEVTAQGHLVARTYVLDAPWRAPEPWRSSSPRASWAAAMWS